MSGGVTLYGPSGTGTDLGRLMEDLAAIVKSIQQGYYVAPGHITDEKVAADAAIAQSKIANLVADLAARATDAELSVTYAKTRKAGVGMVAVSGDDLGVVNPKWYGAIADGAPHPLSEGYSTLAAAQAVYPHATALTDQLDWAAAQKAANSGARAVRYTGHLVTNRRIAPANFQEHFGPGTIENIRARNTPSENQTQACVFKLGNMHPAILNTARADAWAVHDLAPIAAGDTTVTVSTPAGVTQPLAAGDIVIIRSNNTPAAAGVGFTYDFEMFNRVRSWDSATGALVLELPVPATIVASGSTTTLFGPKLCINAGVTDSFTGEPWSISHGVVIRNLTLIGLAPSLRTAMWRCKLLDLDVDVQHLLNIQATVHSSIERITGHWSERMIETKMACHNTTVRDAKGTFKPDATITPKVAMSIGEQSYDMDFEGVECNIGRAHTAAVRALEVWTPRVRFRGRINDFGTGARGEIWSLKSTANLARPPADSFLDLTVRALGGLTQYGLLSSGAAGEEADPSRIQFVLNQRSVEGAAATYVMRCNRGTKLEIISNKGDAQRVLLQSPAEAPERASILPLTIAGPVTYPGSATSSATRTVNDGATTNGSNVVTSATAAFSAGDAGAGISGPGIQPGAWITGVTSATTVTINSNATATAAGVSVTIARSGYSLAGTVTLQGVVVGDQVIVGLQQVGAATAGRFGSLHATATVASLNTVDIYIRNRSALDVTIGGPTAIWVFATWFRSRA